MLSRRHHYLQWLAVLRSMSLTSTASVFGSTSAREANCWQRHRNKWRWCAHVQTRSDNHRFTPVDPRCAMELDEILPSEWAKLEAATDEYIATVSDQLDACVAVLTAGLPDAAGAEGTAGPAAASALRLGALLPASQWPSWYLLNHDVARCGHLRNGPEPSAGLQGEIATCKPRSH